MDGDTRFPTRLRMIYCKILVHSFTYDHRTLKIELPVRSAVLKQCTGGLVVRWVTTGEYPLLYVFVFASVDDGCRDISFSQGNPLDMSLFMRDV
jgi:hypothetical protein